MAAHVSDYDDLIERLQPYYNDLPVEGMKALDELVNAARDLLREKEALQAQLATEMNPRPMDTAPRDGTVIDLWLTGGGRMTDQWWDSEDGTWCGLDDAMFSHWSPIRGISLSGENSK